MKIKNQKFSIVIPVYNTGVYLKQCLNSVVNQSYKNIEIIIVNDGSSDESEEICSRFIKKDQRIKYFYKDNSGLSDARNLGIDNATGDYILFLDSDDYIDCNAIEQLNEVLDRANTVVDIISVFLKQINQIVHTETVLEHTINNEKLTNGNDFFKTELENNTMHMAAVMKIYNRYFLNKNGLRFKSGILHEDEEFTPRVLLNANKVLPTHLNFYNYIVHENSITTQKNMYKNVFDLFSTLKELEEIYMNLNDEYLRKIALNNLLEKYLYMYAKANVYLPEYNLIRNKNFVKHKACTLKNKVKVFLFILNDKLYCYINKNIYRKG